VVESFTFAQFKLSREFISAIPASIALLLAFAVRSINFGSATAARIESINNTAITSISVNDFRLYIFAYFPNYLVDNYYLYLVSYYFYRHSY